MTTTAKGLEYSIGTAAAPAPSSHHSLVEDETAMTCVEYGGSSIPTRVTSTSKSRFCPTAADDLWKAASPSFSREEQTEKKKDGIKNPTPDNMNQKDEEEGGKNNKNKNKNNEDNGEEDKEVENDNDTTASSSRATVPSTKTMTTTTTANRRKKQKRRASFDEEALAELSRNFGRGDDNGIFEHHDQQQQHQITEPTNGTTTTTTTATKSVRRRRSSILRQSSSTLDSSCAPLSENGGLKNKASSNVVGPVVGSSGRSARTTTTTSAVSITRRCSQDAYSLGGGGGGGGNNAAVEGEEPVFLERNHQEMVRDQRKVVRLRGFFFLALLATTTVSAALTYIYVSREEISDFESKYYDSVIKVAEGFQKGVSSKAWAASTFSAMYTSRFSVGGGGRDGNDGNLVWPNATLRDFQEQARGNLLLANGRALSFNPVITKETRSGWEQHALESAHMLGAPSLLKRTSPNSRIVADGIYSVQNGTRQDDPGYNADSKLYPHTMVPVWQIAPIEGNAAAVMFNLHAEPKRQRALDDMMYYGVPTMTAILQLVQDEQKRPSSILFYPVIALFEEKNTTTAMTTNTRPMSDANSQQVVGSISIVFSWDDVLNQLLPNYIKGMICVLKSSIGQAYTFLINGDVVQFLGQGDLHDFRFNDMERTVQANLEGTQRVLGVVENLITYQLVLYPSKQFREEYTSHRPILYTACVVAIFSVTSLLFVYYNYLVDHRQETVSKVAQRSGRIVNSLFPRDFQERLFQTQEETTTTAPPATTTTATTTYPKRQRRNQLQQKQSKLSSDSRSVTSNVTATAATIADADVVVDADPVPAALTTTSTTRQGNTSPTEKNLEAMENGVYSTSAEAAANTKDILDSNLKTDGSFESQQAQDSPLKGGEGVDGSSTSISPGRKCARIRRRSSFHSFGAAAGSHIPSTVRTALKGFLLKGGRSGAGNNTTTRDIDPDYDVNSSSNNKEQSPIIASLFPETSIMFGDLVGFTAWSSKRSPNEVFQLLEAVYWEFDKLAEAYGVFKLGTIGDCYIAVTGLPDPMEDHASVLCEFCAECQAKFDEMMVKLADRLPNTQDLAMRFGIHSGPVTAGILRGYKSRFELFGDTINTASRMESTGRPHCIQVSQETADLVSRDGMMGSWLVPRKGLVTAKGKGELQTYWLVPYGDAMDHNSNCSDPSHASSCDIIDATTSEESRTNGNTLTTLNQQQPMQQLQHEQDDDDIVFNSTRKTSEALPASPSFSSSSSDGIQHNFHDIEHGCVTFDLSVPTTQQDH